MIKVLIKENNIEISGHANFNDYGKDIVCASVSSIVYTTINGILNINDKALLVTDNNNLNIKILSNDNITNKLIDNMITLLKDLEKQYPKNLKIK